MPLPVFEAHNFVTRRDALRGIFTRLGQFLTIVTCLGCLTTATPCFSAPRIALVLSGGGARGLAQIGVLKAFEEKSIRPSLIVGNSMGAVVGGLYAAGYSADSIAATCKRVAWSTFFQNSAQRANVLVSQKTEPGNYLFEVRFDSDLMPVLPSSISTGQAFYDLLIPRLAAAQYRAGMDFDSLPIALRIVATDIVTGENVVLSKGDMATAIRASSGVPLAFSPVPVGSMLLIDGGITANIPVDAARTLNPDLVIAVDVTSPMWPRKVLDNPLRIADQIVNIGMSRQKREQKARADVAIEPDLKGFTNTDFTRIDSLISRGYRAAQAALPQIDSLLAVLADTGSGEVIAEIIVKPPFKWVGADSTAAHLLDTCLDDVVTRYPQGIPLPVFRSMCDSVLTAHHMPFARIKKIARAGPFTLIDAGSGRVEDVVITGNARTSTRLLRGIVDVHPGDALNEVALSNTVSSVFGTNLFENVSIEVDPGSAVRIKVKEKKYLRVRTGLRFDEFHLLEGYVEPAYENFLGWGICSALHLQYGLRREKYALDLSGALPFSRHVGTSVRLQGFISRETITEREEIPADSADTTNLVTRYRFDEQTLRKAGFLALIGSEVGKSVLVEGGIRIEQFKIWESQTSIFNDRLGSFKSGMRLLMARIVVDNTDEFPFPTQGQKHYFSVGGAHAALGGTESFIKLEGSASGYLTPRRRHTIIPRLQFSWASDTLPDVERCFLGGALPQEKYQDISVYNYVSYVGLSPRAWPGDAMTVLELGYRFAMRRDLYLTAVLDWGYTWSSGYLQADAESFRRFLRDAPLGIGAGVAWNTVIGPVSFTWGRIFTNREILADLGVTGENTFYLSAGHDF